MKPFTLVTVFVLAFVAIMQLTRLMLGWEVTINNLDVPLWASAIGFLAAAGLAVMVWREAKK